MTHDLLQIVTIQVVPSHMAIALPGWIRFNDDSVGHGHGNFYLLFDSTEVEDTINLQVRKPLHWVVSGIIAKARMQNCQSQSFALHYFVVLHVLHPMLVCSHF